MTVIFTMTVSKELNQALTSSSGRSLTSLQTVLVAIVVIGDWKILRILQGKKEQLLSFI